MKSTSVLGLIILLVAATVSGCATQPTRYYSSVDSLARPDTVEKNRYALLPGGKETDSSDLQFQEFASYVEMALGQRGFVKSNSFEDADIVIFFTYAIGDPKTYQYTYSIPTFGQTGVSSARTSGTVDSYGSTATYSGTTTYTPTYGMTGQSTQLANVTTYSRFLVLDAYDVDAYTRDKKMSQVWKSSVTSTGSSGDLRLVMPYMVSALQPYLGTNTGRKIDVTVLANDPNVLALRGSGVQAEK